MLLFKSQSDGLHENSFQISKIIFGIEGNDTISGKSLYWGGHANSSPFAYLYEDPLHI